MSFGKLIMKEVMMGESRKQGRMKEEERRRVVICGTEEERKRR